MLPLVPDWAQHYGEFWRAVRVRNLWFIRLRYFAALILCGFFLVGEFLLDLNFSKDQIIAILSISFLILIYNIILHKFQNYAGNDPNKFNCLHLSLIQMILDLTFLMILVYYTGLIESPLYLFFIFHMIIGSMVLPGYIVYLAAGLISFSFTILALFERLHSIKNHFISGLSVGSHLHTLTYDILFIIIFTLMLFISVYIANRIAHQLYRREQQLRTSLEKLNEAEIAKQKYTIGIVHEIKTPIAAVRSILDIIHKGFVGSISDEVDRKIERAELRTEEALKLINDIVKISKVKLLEIKLTDDINLDEFIAKVIDNFMESAKDKSVNIFYKNKSGKLLVIKSDKILFELLISNLIANSIKYVDENGVVEVNVNDLGENFSIEVCDNGIGIPQEESKKIFEQFYRASNIDKKVHGGTGMGLAIVKEIVERLGGVIKITSPSPLAEEGKPGSKFEIVLPYSLRNSENDKFEVNNEGYLINNSNY
ncbi:MAG: HAMP domain-containing sensor histidine kinase [Ignavibacteriales bacterium]|nr:HAMP domain-containing sensor histidine kinase [Ignavibacteriales bacterium]